VHTRAEEISDATDAASDDAKLASLMITPESRAERPEW
jgi:hypothetical protein